MISPTGDKRHASIILNNSTIGTIFLSTYEHTARKDMAHPRNTYIMEKFFPILNVQVFWHHTAILVRKISKPRNKVIGYS